MMKPWIGFAALMLTAGCKPGGAPTATTAPPAHRMIVRAVTGSTVHFIPEEGQLPYCLIYTRSGRGTTRQITMTKGQTSVPCPAREPVLGLTYRIPVEEGRVTVFTFFSDQRLNAPQVSDQLVELGDGTHVAPMNLRLPGKVVLDVNAFSPVLEADPTEGTVVETSPKK